MIYDTETLILESLGTEPKEIFNCSTDDELEELLEPLMQEATQLN